MRLEGKVAVISGACSGLGRATALRFAQEGAKLVLGDINEQAASALIDEIVAAGSEAMFVRLDVRNESNWVELFEQSQARFGQVDVVMNSAGIAVPGNVEDMSFEDWKRELDVNLNGTFFGTKHGMKALKTRGGSIINLSSIEGIVGIDTYAAYSAGKAGVRNLTKSAALHAGRKGYKVRVNSIHPGYIKTPMVGDDPAELARLARLHPIGHLGEPMDIANMALFLASDESKFATGAEFVIDGGFLAQ
ncbi:MULTISPECIES: SDR family oxidoreductase [Pseudomonas]|uniref:SDR family oxidoreductase n=1 Tax=Pseudomonas sessilinigenes TaxID=658629 RepID=A0ABX8MV44_9PSED|nr:MULTISPECIES: SDR family oxidoreductase [Pseudomonas]AZC24123.1 3-oxoacyl-ACP reductase [Pseudomonas sessilinigenes]QIH08693.1 SDR family oxidoreductase [Pseudomonas sp. BIOMIG1BAC]QXH43083.1 SDR family oxidoreductase [Pseudomonas sessilinigenes]